MNKHREPLHLLATGSAFTFGLRPEYSILQSNHYGCIDRPPFTPMGGHVQPCCGSVCIDAPNDFPEDTTS
jgi:hypothetical protein